MIPAQPHAASIEEYVDQTACDLIAFLPDADRLSLEDHRGIIARYTAVLEGNFIYWMTAAYISVVSEEARSTIHDNLYEEVRDNHPGMLRKFALAAQAAPTEADAAAVQRDLQSVRLWVAELPAPKIVLMMAFFEAFITRFMPYLAGLATRRGSTEQEYTEVHGTLDAVHTRGLLRAFDAEMALRPRPVPPAPNLFAGVEVLRTLIRTIIDPRAQ